MNQPATKKPAVICTVFTILVIAMTIAALFIAGLIAFAVSTAYKVSI